MNRRKITSLIGEVQFLPDMDQALIGYATRFGTQTPCYSWLRAMHYMKGMDPVVALGKAQGLFIHNLFPSPLILMPVNRPVFWDRVAQGKIKVWDQLHDAIIGTGRRGLDPEVAVYSQPRVLKRLQRLMESDAREFFETQMETVWQGPGTPWTLYPVQ